MRFVSVSNDKRQRRQPEDCWRDIMFAVWLNNFKYRNVSDSKDAGFRVKRGMMINRRFLEQSNEYKDERGRLC